MSIFKDKVLLITGGTGSFGNAVLRRYHILYTNNYVHIQRQSPPYNRRHRFLR